MNQNFRNDHAYLYSPKTLKYQGNSFLWENIWLLQLLFVFLQPSKRLLDENSIA